MTEKFTTKKAAQAVLLSIIALVIAQVAAQILSSIAYVLTASVGISNLVSSIIYVIAAYFLLRILCGKILKISLEECHIIKPKFNMIWVICAFLLPLLVSGIFLCLPGEMVNNDFTAIQIFDLVTTAVFYYGISTGIVEEFVFRGIIMHALERRWNKKVAIILPSMLFGLVHIIGADLNLISMLLVFVAGTAVGILFSLVVYESKSIWNSVIMHGAWNMIVIGGILKIDSAYDENAIFSYQLASKSFFITGGDFGIESSIISVVGYILFAVLAFVLIKRKVKAANN